MRVLMTSVWSTHFLPMVPTGWALRAAGHDVRVAVQPAHADVVATSGLPLTVVGRDVEVIRRRGGDGAAANGGARAAGAGPAAGDGDGQARVGGQANGNGDAPASGGARRSGGDGSGAGKGGGVPRERIVRAVGTFVGVADAMADDLVGLSRAWRPDLIVHDPLTFAGPLTAAVLGVPAVRHLWGADMTAGQADTQASLLAEVPLFWELLERFGLSELEDLGTLTLDPCPPSVQLPAALPRQNVRFVPYNGPGVQPPWAAGLPPAPRVCVTWGSTVARFAGQIPFPAGRAVEAAVALGAEVIVATTSDQLPALPDGVRVAESVPLHMLLPACSAIVHQGGGGTTLTALRHGVPQLVMGQLPDHAFHASRVAAAGAGIALDPALAEPQAIREALSALMGDPSYGAAAGRVRLEMARQPAPTQVVGVLERLAASGAEAA
ncbi:nucleotide disphospho-sugar-binding domain-containing protein [Sphaerisporangium sp. TRM90804]|uniref:nucleotide disphospho-sugar-binding domain-containing protein n=1 Tax=Sphaerisporangium sp. TRM90804 TaxID=3031113 RepID=UPI002446A754|nr:nucleotide disphospho-sugar-binding domain-containing protein [Sphaerisporangium sp. TRM90804]MDH2427201.1 DUF1205 domain-containing protein [Sphaerisporangium sp. TRM90804]